MRETMEFRIPEEDARRYLEPSIGVSLTTVRKIVVATDDPLYTRICEIDRRIRKRTNGKDSFFLGWIPRRRYTQAELNAAELFKVEIKRTFEPSGEECGTIYDELTACKFCGAGAVQKSDLMLQPRSLAKKGDLSIARTIVDEIVVADRFVELFESHGLSGVVFRTVRRKGKGGAVLAGWRQLFETEHLLRIVDPTKVGNGPTDDDPTGEYRCPEDHTIGLNLISELWISRHDFEKRKPDIAFTEQRIGVRRGLLRPRPELLISARLRKAILEAGLQGFGFEIAHLSSAADIPPKPANALVQREQKIMDEVVHRVFGR